MFLLSEYVNILLANLSLDYVLFLPSLLDLTSLFCLSIFLSIACLVYHITIDQFILHYNCFVSKADWNDILLYLNVEEPICNSQLFLLRFKRVFIIATYVGISVNGSIQEYLELNGSIFSLFLFFMTLLFVGNVS